MNLLIIYLLALLLAALFKIRSLYRDVKLLSEDKQWFSDQVCDRNNKLLVLSNKYDKLLGEKAELDHRIGRLTKTVQDQVSELRRKHCKVVR